MFVILYFLCCTLPVLTAHIVPAWGSGVKADESVIVLPDTAFIVLSCTPPSLSIIKKVSPIVPTDVSVLSSTTTTVGLVTVLILPLALIDSFNLSATLITSKGSSTAAASKPHSKDTISASLLAL